MRKTIASLEAELKNLRDLNATNSLYHTSQRDKFNTALIEIEQLKKANVRLESDLRWTRQMCQELSTCLVGRHR